MDNNSDIRKVLIGGNHLATVLIRFGTMPPEIKNPDELDGFLRDVWIAWKAIMDLRDGLDSDELKRVVESV